MPRLPQPESLVKLCVKCVTNASRRSANKIPAVMRNCNMTAINSKSFTNAFHQLRKFTNKKQHFILSLQDDARINFFKYFTKFV